MKPEFQILIGSLIGWLSICLLVFFGIACANHFDWEILKYWSIFLKSPLWWVLGIAWAIIALLYIGIYWWGTDKKFRRARGSVG